MRFINIIIFCALCSALIQCDDEVKKSNLSGLPELDKDPSTFGLRDKFLKGTPLTPENQQFLAFNEVRDCTSFSAKKNDRDDVVDVRKTFEIGAGNSIILYDVRGESNKKATDSFFFVPGLGLVATRTADDAIYNFSSVLRLTQEHNDLIMEQTVRIDPAAPGNNTAALALIRSDFAVSAVDQNRYAQRYMFCRNVQRSQALDSGILGACRPDSDDDVMNSEEGGCYSFAQRIAYSVRSAKKMPFSVREKDKTQQQSADEYCKLSESGFPLWRKAKREELEAIAGNLARRYLDFSLDDHSQSVAAKSSEIQPAEFWTFYEESQDGIWTVELSTGKKKFRSRYDDLAFVLCVRDVEDYDGDGVPNSSDRCQNTAKGSKVYHSGDLKGCSLTKAKS